MSAALSARLDTAVSAQVTTEGGKLIAWINLASMVVSVILCLYFYVKSAGPAALEEKVGETAYRKCTSGERRQTPARGGTPLHSS